MILAHLSELHLGFRAHARGAGGVNGRERDVERALRRSAELLAGVGPDVVLIVGDVFDGPAPTPRPVRVLAGWLRELRELLPGARVVLVAGARDRPLAGRGPGALELLPAIDGVDIVAREPRRLRPGDGPLSLLCVPFPAGGDLDLAGAVPDAGAESNVLAVQAAPVGTGGPVAEGSPALPVDLEGWDYVALGGAHAAGEVRQGAWHAGALERTSGDPWSEAVEEKGFLVVELPGGEPAFHAVPGRPVVEMAPIDARGLDGFEVAAKIRDAIGVLPGGIDGKIVRLRVRGLRGEARATLDRGLVAGLRRRAFHLALALDIEPGEGADPGPGRTGGSLREALDPDALIDDHLSRAEPPVPPSLRRRILGDGASRVGEVGLVAIRLLELGLPSRGGGAPVVVAPPRGIGALVAEEGGHARAFLAGALMTLAGGVACRPGGEDAGVLRAAVEVAGSRRTLRREGAGWVEEEGDEAVGPDSLPGLFGISTEAFRAVWLGIDGDDRLLTLPGATTALLDATVAPRLDRMERRTLARLREGAPGPGGGGEGAPALGMEAVLELLDAEVSRLDEITTERRTLVSRIRGAERELRDLRAEAAEVAGDLEVRRMEWLRERQDAETQLQAYRDRARELKARLRQIESAESDVPCPTCGVPLGDAHGEVVAELRDEWEDVVQDGQWWKRRREQLEDKPGEIRELEARHLRLGAAIEEGAQRLERQRLLAARLEAEASELRRKTGLLEGLRRGAGGTGGEDESAAGDPGEPDAAADPPPEPSLAALRTLLEGIDRSRERLRRRGAELLAARASRHVVPISDGEYEGLVAGEGERALLLRNARERLPAGAGERAVVALSLQLALGELLGEIGSGPGGEADLPSVVVGEALGALDRRLRGGALRHLASTASSRFGQILVVTDRETVEGCPEAFDAIVEIEGDPAAGEASTATLPAPPLRLVPPEGGR